MGDTCHDIIGVSVTFDGFSKKFKRKLYAEATFFFFAYYSELSANFYISKSVLQIA